MTALIKATFGKNYQIVKKLVMAGSDVNIVNKSNNTALMYAIYSKSMKSVRKLIKYKADVNCQKPDEGVTHL